MIKKILGFLSYVFIGIGNYLAPIDSSNKTPKDSTEKKRKILELLSKDELSDQERKELNDLTSDGRIFVMGDP